MKGTGGILLLPLLLCATFNLTGQSRTFTAQELKTNGLVALFAVRRRKYEPVLTLPSAFVNSFLPPSFFCGLELDTIFLRTFSYTLDSSDYRTSVTYPHSFVYIFFTFYLSLSPFTSTLDLFPPPPQTFITQRLGRRRMRTLFC